MSYVLSFSPEEKYTHGIQDVQEKVGEFCIKSGLGT
jgi:hypothetical protein